jgi:hypothetical protein
MRAALTIALAVCLTVALPACGETPEPRPVQPIICPASATASLEAEPVRPTMTPEQQTAFDVAAILALGEDMGVAIIRYFDAEQPAYQGRLQARIEATRVWCEEVGG